MNTMTARTTGRRIRWIAAPAFAFTLLAALAPQTIVHRLSANGMSFAYIEQGKGSPVILVHGSISDYREWSKQMAPLAHGYRVIAYSRRYHWPNLSPGQDADVTLQRQADDLAAIIRALGVAPAHIVGHSKGGSVAVLLALQHPEMVRTLVLADPGLGQILRGTAENDAFSKEAQAVRAQMQMAFDSADPVRIVKTFLADVAPGEFEKAPPETRQMFLANVSAFQLDYISPRYPFTCADVGRIGTPVLVVTGERSPSGFQRIAEATARCLKAGTLLTIPEATHHMQSDQPQLFNRAVRTFLAAH